jgi:hypothetical protein
MPLWSGQSPGVPRGSIPGRLGRRDRVDTLGGATDSGRAVSDQLFVVDGLIRLSGIRWTSADSVVTVLVLLGHALQPVAL